MHDPAEPERRIRLLFRCPPELATTEQLETDSRHKKRSCRRR